MNKGGWAELPDELVAKVLELLQAAGRSAPQVSTDWRVQPQAEGFGFGERATEPRPLQAW